MTLDKPARLPMRTATQVSNYLTKVQTYEAGSPVTNKIILGGPYAWDTYTGTDRPSDDVTVDGHAGFRERGHLVGQGEVTQLALIQQQPRLFAMDGQDKLRISLPLPDVASRLRTARDLLQQLRPAA